MIVRDDVPLTEQERNAADHLLNSVLLLDEEPTRVVRLTDTTIEMLQHGLLLLKTVQDSRVSYLTENGEREDVLERNLTLRNIRQLYAWLENAKDQTAI